MDLAAIRDYCLSLPGVTEDIKWEHHLCFNVGEKMFVITSPDEVPVNASFKTTEEGFARLCSRAGFKPASHLARYHWVHISDVSLIGDKEWRQLIDEAYRLVAARLPKGVKQRLNIPY